jgi:hypothetical protein
MKKFEVRGLRPPCSDIVTRKTYGPQPTDEYMNIEVTDAVEPLAFAILCFGFPGDRGEGFFKPAWQFPNPGRHAFIGWRLTPVKKTKLELSNEEWLRQNPDIAKLMEAA